MQKILLVLLFLFAAPFVGASDFKTESQYIGVNRVPMGKKLVHSATGTVVHLLRMDTVPQASVIVQTPVMAGRGEPHVCEHLLLSKGSKGLAFSLLGDMVLGDSTAGTYTTFTDYQLYSAAGVEAFQEMLNSQLEALLRPDFTTTAVRREAYQFTVQSDADGKLDLIESGTIYNEMLDSEDKYISYRDMLQRLYGPDNPIVKISGGHPPEIRQLRGTHLWSFHKERYRLGSGLEIILFLPPKASEKKFLANLSQKFRELDRGRSHQRSKAFQPPTLKPSEDHTILISQRPEQDENATSNTFVAWPLLSKFSVEDDLLLSSFLRTFAGGPTSTLHKDIAAKETQIWDSGVGSISSSTTRGLDDGYMYISLNSMAPNYITAANLERARDEILKKLRWVSELPDNSPELREFNEQARGILLKMGQSTKVFLTSPPKIGNRGTSDSWRGHLQEMSSRPGKFIDLTYDTVIDPLAAQISSGKNIWRALIEKHNLLQTPYVTASRPNAKIFEANKQAAEKRRQAKIKQLLKKYSTNDKQVALAQFQAEYDADTTRMLAKEKAVRSPGFVKNPPLGPDPDLKLVEQDLNGASVLTGKFAATPSLYFSLLFEIDNLPPKYLIYLDALSTLLMQSGVIQDGVRTPYKQVTQILRETTHSVAINTHTSGEKDLQLDISGSGTNIVEFKNALHWVFLIAKNSDFTTENLPRLREALDSLLQSRKTFMRGSEERWLRNPAAAFRNRQTPAVFNASSVLTQVHQLHRLKWRLAGGLYNESELEQGVAFAKSLKANGFENASAGEHGRLVTELIKDLKSRTAEINPPQLNQEYAYLVDLYLQELGYGPVRTLEDLIWLREQYVTRGPKLRGILSTDSQNQEAAVAALSEQLLSVPTKSQGPEVQAYAEGSDPIALNLIRRGVELPKEFPIYVGLVNEQSQNGNMVIGSRRTDHRSRVSDEELFTALGIQMLGGSGAHGFFMQTWQKGLAYSNGANSSTVRGTVQYYAERNPSIRDTMKFVKQVADGIDNLNVENITDYILANVFSSRLDMSPGARVENQAEDIWEGLGPEVQKEHYQRILDLSKREDFLERVKAGARRGLSTIFVNWGDPQMRKLMNSQFFFVAPESQLVDMEKEIGDGQLIRLYPSDFWDRRQ